METDAYNFHATQLEIVQNVIIFFCRFKMRRFSFLANTLLVAVLHLLGNVKSGIYLLTTEIDREMSSHFVAYKNVKASKYYAC